MKKAIDDAGKKLYNFLHTELGLSFALLRKLLRSGKIRTNNLRKGKNVLNGASAGWRRTSISTIKLSAAVVQ